MAAGEPIHEDGDVHAAVVVVASRIADVAGTGEVFVSDRVRQLVVGKQYDFQDQSEQSMKGFNEPLRMCRRRSLGLKRLRLHNVNASIRGPTMRDRTADRASRGHVFAPSRNQVGMSPLPLTSISPRGSRM